MSKDYYREDCALQFINYHMTNKLKVLCIVPAVNAPFIINVLQPLEILKARGKAEFTVKKEKDALIQDVISHHVVLFFRNSSPALLKLLHFSRISGKPVVYAVDDNFFEFAHSEKGPMAQVQLNAHSRYLVNADLVMVYSNLMVERVSRYNENVMKMLPGGINFSIFDGLEKSRNNKIKIIYATSRYKKDILSQLFLPALKKILLEYREQVEINLWGYRPKELNDIPGVNHIEQMEYGRYMRRLYSEGFDIGLAPLKDDLFHRSKTNTKFRDYGACGIAGIYSNVDVYSDVEDGKTGLLVENNDKAWYGALKRLIEDENLRGTIKRNAYRHARINYDMNETADKLYETLRKTADTKGDKKARVPVKNKVAAQFLDLRPPRVVLIKTPEDSRIKELRGLMKIYRYPLIVIRTFKDSPTNRKLIASSDVIICPESYVQRLGEVTGDEKFKSKVLYGNNLDIMNGIEDYYYKIILAGGREPVYSFSLKVIRIKIECVA